MKIICIGRNYAAHAKELNNAVPTEPVIFMKGQNALLPPGKSFYYPEFTQDVHYECELVVKICRNGRHIQEKFAPKYFNEISLGIDFTARDVQQRLKDKGLPWELAKAFDGSAAIGKFIPLEEKNIQDLSFELSLNGTIVQQGHTGQMIFPVAKIIAFVSQYCSLNTGDLIFTGTPAGVGPVQVGDQLSGSLLGRQLLNVAIR
jgi:2-keto-4-pentenoate hydratase/2-oxohepta-3-ene-1,7-dioic acid hydratase in catechol pathway